MIYTDGTKTIANTRDGVKVHPHYAYATALLDNAVDVALHEDRPGSVTAFLKVADDPDRPFFA